jgi:hypothetical protein
MANKNSTVLAKTVMETMMEKTVSTALVIKVSITLILQNALLFLNTKLLI